MHLNNNEFEDRTSSYWLASVPRLIIPLCRKMQTDVAIVGGGMARITTAFLLKMKGFKVTVVEADRFCTAPPVIPRLN